MRVGDYGMLNRTFIAETKYAMRVDRDLNLEA